MNAGMFHPKGQPVGLHIAQGKEWFPINTQEGYGNFFMKPNGIFGIERDDTPFIVSTSRYLQRQKDSPRLATQSGPMLLENGNIHPELQPESKNFHIRNAVGVTKEKNVIFVISLEPVRFYELALLLRDVYRCTDALYLDGAISVLHTPQHPEIKKGTGLGGILIVGDKSKSP